MATFNSHYPVTGEVLASYEITERDEVNLAVDLARDASYAWVALGFAGRRKVLLRWSKLLMQRVDEIAA